MLLVSYHGQSGIFFHWILVQHFRRDVDSSGTLCRKTQILVIIGRISLYSKQGIFCMYLKLENCSLPIIKDMPIKHTWWPCWEKSWLLDIPLNESARPLFSEDCCFPRERNFDRQLLLQTRITLSPTLILNHDINSLKSWPQLRAYWDSERDAPTFHYWQVVFLTPYL